MKNKKRALRRHKSKCKLEKRLKIWVRQGMGFHLEDQLLRNIGGHEIEIVKNEIRYNGYWTFLKWTSNPCSCSMCQGEHYKRLTKSEFKKLINEQLE